MEGVIIEDINFLKFRLKGGFVITRYMEENRVLLKLIDLCGLSGNAGVLFKRSGVFTGMWRFYYCQFQRSTFHSCTKRKYDCCAPDAA